MLSKFNLKQIKERIKHYEKEKIYKVVLTHFHIEIFPENILFTTNYFTKIIELDLSNNLLATLPMNFKKLTQLENFNLSNNRFNVFPEVICFITNLRTLNLSYNFIPHLPSTISNLERLSLLNMLENPINKVADEIYYLKELKDILINNNCISPIYHNLSMARIKFVEELTLVGMNLVELPVGLVRLAPHLRCLNISDNSLEELNSHLFRLTNLTILEIRNNKLTEIPDAIVGLSKLQILALSKNQLTNLPSVITSLQKLELLNLSENQFNVVPQEIFRLTTLKNFYFNHNQCQILPKEFIELKNNLEIISIMHNQLENLNLLNFFAFKNLKVLNFSGNKKLLFSAFTYLFSSVKEGSNEHSNLKTIELSETGIPVKNQIIIINLLSGSEKLDLSGLNFKELPKYLIYLKIQTKNLNLSNNNLISFPEILLQFSELETLNLSLNHLKEITFFSKFYEIQFFYHLTDLDLSDNKFLHFPEDILKIKTLKKLNLSKNQIEILLPEIKELKNLEEVNFSENRMRQLPEEFFQLTSLIRINFAKNNLKKIPKTIHKLQNLLFFNVKKNNIRIIPKEILELPQIEWLDFSSNPLMYFFEEMDSGNFEGNLFENFANFQFPNNLRCLNLAKNSFQFLPKILFSQFYSIPNFIIDHSFFLPIFYERIFSQSPASSEIHFLPCKEINFWLLSPEDAHSNFHLNFSFLFLNDFQMAAIFEELKSISKFCGSKIIADFCGNHLMNIPEDILELNRLQFVDFSSNHLSDISILQMLPDLIEIKANNNEIKDFPVGFSKLKNLRRLSLCHNGISSLPNCLFKFKNLKELLMSNNQISALPFLPLNLFVNLRNNPLAFSEVCLKPPSSPWRPSSPVLHPRSFSQPPSAVTRPSSEILLFAETNSQVSSRELMFLPDPELLSPPPSPPHPREL